MPEIVSDEQLMQRVIAGERRALESLLRRHAAELLSYLARIQPDRGRAEDAFQETWLRVWTRRRSFDAARRFRPWLFRIARNTAISSLRHAAGRNAEALCSDPIRRADEPMAGLEQTEAIEAAGRAIDALPTNQREIVCLRLYASMEYAQIAGIMQTSESTVRSNMCIALRRLRERLTPRPADTAAGSRAHDQRSPKRSGD